MSRLVLSAALAALVFAAATSQAAAQDVRYLPRFDFRVDAEHLSGDDPRFVWDANFGGDMDLVDFGAGRVSFAANYEVVMGEEIKAFDPNQGNYILEGAATARLGSVEVGGVFYHQSRHLSDRFKRQAVDWNSIGARVRGGAAAGRARFEGRADLRGVIQRAFVDYRWELEGDGRAAYDLHPRVALVAGTTVRVVGVTGSRDRGTQAGVRGEGGIRMSGDGAAAEFFLAVERRVDPYPLEFGAATWFTTGFRLSSR